jgi:outer membrane protein, heavy metal efflux system
MPLLFVFSLERIVDATEGSVRLSIEDAVARAETLSPLVRRARASRKVAASQRTGAALVMPFNPAIWTTAGHRWDSSGSNPASQGPEWSMRLEQPVEVAGQRGTRMREVARAINVAEARERFAIVESHARTRSAYVAALLTQRFVEFARRREDLAGRVLESARARVRVGAASDVELKLAEVEVGRLQHDRIAAELAVGRALNELRLLAGIDLSAPVELATQLALPPAVQAPLENFLGVARNLRADLQALERTKSQIDAVIVRLRREVVPSPTLFADVAQQQPGQTYVGGGLGFILPFWQRNQGPLAIARAEKERTDEERLVLDQEIAADIANVFSAVAAARREVDIIEKIVVPAAEASLELITQGWKAGKFDLFRVVQASREVGEALRRQLEVLGELWHATIELARATGTA